VFFKDIMTCLYWFTASDSRQLKRALPVANLTFFVYSQLVCVTEDEWNLICRHFDVDFVIKKSVVSDSIGCVAGLDPSTLTPGRCIGWIFVIQCVASNEFIVMTFAFILNVKFTVHSRLNYRKFKLHGRLVIYVISFIISVRQENEAVDYI
jgi:hypothetical protein